MSCLYASIGLLSNARSLREDASKEAKRGLLRRGTKASLFCLSQYEEIISFLFETHNLNFSFSRKFAKTWLNLDYVYYKFPNHQYCKNLQGKTHAVFWLFSGCFLVAIELLDYDNEYFHHHLAIIQ